MCVLSDCIAGCVECWLLYNIENGVRSKLLLMLLKLFFAIKLRRNYYAICFAFLNPSHCLKPFRPATKLESEH